MVISNKYKFVFIEIPKTATTSITNGLARAFGRHNLELIKTSERHCTLERCLNLNPHVANFQKFLFVRNHWDIATSFYLFEKSLGKHNLEFCDWIKGWYINQTSWMYPSVNFIGRYENLQEDFNFIVDKLGGKQTYLKKINTSENRDRNYKEFYTESTKEILFNNCNADINRLGYDFNF